MTDRLSQKLSINELKTLLKKLNVETYLKSNKIEYREAGDSENPQLIVHTCPFCKNVNYKGNVHANRLYIGQKNQKFRCYNCSTEGSFLKFAAKFEHLSFRNLFDKYLGEGVFEALPDILSEYLEEEDEKENRLDPIKEMEMPEEFKHMFPFSAGNGIETMDPYKYLINRGMNSSGNSIYKKLDFRYCEYFEYQPAPDKIHVISKRIIFPVYWEGKLVGFQGRDITGNSNIKYYISQGLPKKRIIYNYENIKDVETITICEGIIDLVKCWSHNPTCVFGSYLSTKQLQLLQDMPNLKNIILAVDPDTKVPDKNGNIKYDRLVEQLKPFWNILEINIPMGEDMGGYSFEKAKEILSAATPYKEKGLTSDLN